MSAPKKIHKHGAQILCLHDAAYPALLKNTEGAPPVLTVKGQLHFLQKDIVAVVGARNASINGKNFAGKIAQELGAAGYVTSSGLARGVDTKVHASSFGTGTIGVIANGIDVVYPHENAVLYQQVVEQGVLVTEYPFASKPQARQFPARNRIISGMARGVVVVEAGRKSGSLITARYALEQGRDVFAVPGSPFDPRNHGSNKLIQDGACLIQGTEDILRELEQGHFQLREEESVPFKTPPAPASYDEVILKKARENVIQYLGATPTAIDDIVRETDLPINMILTILLEFELAGRIEHFSGNRVALNYKP
ncbi:MAG: DNA-processing protein DprA [Alphaproteobacteria bacterium]